MLRRTSGEKKVRAEALASVARAQAKGQQIVARAHAAKAKHLSKKPFPRSA